MALLYAGFTYPYDVTGPLTVAMAIAARLGVNIAANIGFQYAAEMLPTVVRAQGVSLIHIIGYFAHIIGPYVIYLVSISREMRRDKFFFFRKINEIRKIRRKKKRR